jgi:hypothetical protein
MIWIQSQAMKTLPRSKAGKGRRSSLIPGPVVVPDPRFEFATLKKLHHVCLVRLIDVIDDPVNDRIHLGTVISW